MLTDLLNIKYPIIMAPMFLVSNEDMVVAALENGITGALPALNYRTPEELAEAIRRVKERSSQPFGINLIVNKSNPKAESQLKAILNEKPAFIITSLGNPKKAIEACHANGIKVFCDVTDVEMAIKVSKLGADAIIAVNNQAGGHAGKLSADKLIPAIKAVCSTPVISAGGVVSHNQMQEIIQLGADGISAGTPFIATKECGVTQEYKQAIVNYGKSDVVMTDKLSGSSLTVINTPYVQQIGTSASWLTKMTNKNRQLKRFSKMILAARGMKNLRNAAFKATYKTVWVAGPCIEHINSIGTVSEVIRRMINENSQREQ